jgi:hypothetical protein
MKETIAVIAGLTEARACAFVGQALSPANQFFLTF